MEVRFFLTSNDILNFTKYSLGRPRSRAALGILFLVIFLILFIPFLPSLLSGGDDFATLFNLLLPLFFLVIFMILLIAFISWRNRSNTRSPLALQGEQIITIGPEGFRQRNNFGDSLIFWHAFKEITADKYNLYFIHISNRTVAHVVPRRAFANPQDAELFLAWAQRYRNGPALSQPVGPAGPSATYERWN